LTPKVLHYYAGGNTSKGFYHFFPSILEGLDRIYILKGGPGTGKSTLIKKIGEKWGKKYDIEYLHCSADYGSVDGVIIPKLSVAIVDGTAPHIIEPQLPGIVEEYINLGVAWDSDKLKQHKKEVAQIKSEIKKCYDEAYSLFHEALLIHDEWENIYISNLDKEKAEALKNQLIYKFFGNIKLNKQSKEVHRFLGAATPDGPKDFIPNITEDIAKRYFLKGRPGTGKSTLLKALAECAKEKGIDVEIYHCGFDPESLDMLIFRELSIAIFDSTSPHEYFPSRNSDEIVDMYEEIIKPGTDGKYAEEISHFKEAYQEKMKQGIAKLKESHGLRMKLESYYINAIDFSIIEDIGKEIDQEIAKIELSRK
jgi:Cdc6-like AAA superfamily ATPase